jgi:hypothetical protein
MPPLPLPRELEEMLARPNAVIATVRADGSPHTAATWYDWEDGRVLPLTVLDGSTWYRQLTLLGRIVAISADAALRDIDRLSIRYTGEAFADRTQRRVSASMQPETWSSWRLPHHASELSTR